MVGKRPRTTSPIIECRAVVVRSTQSDGSAVENSRERRCLCGKVLSMTQALSGSCQSCLHKVRISRGSSDNDSSEPEENPSTDNRRSKRRIGRPKKIPSNNVTRFCANSSCGNPLPLDYSYKRCQPCIRAYHERYRMNIACAGRCGARIPRNSSLKTCSACRKGGHKNRSPRLCRRYKKCGNSLPVASPFKSCASCLEYDREQRRQRVARASRVTNRDSDVGDRDSNVHETIVIDLSSEGEDEELEENPHQELESHNAQVKELETELIRAKKKASQKLPSLTEQLNYADSRLESFMQHGHRVDLTNDTHSQLVEFEEKKQLKQENERLHKEITELKCQLNNIIQHDLAEHTHLNILNRLLLQTRHDLLHENISTLVVIETFDNLSSQLRELADRHLENIPVGFGSIMGVISHQNGRANIEDGNEVYTAGKQQYI